MAYRNEWMLEVKEELERNGIRYEVADFRYYIFYCYRKRDGARYTYYAGSGRILGMKEMGLSELIRLCNDSGKDLRYEELRKDNSLLFYPAFMRGVPVWNDRNLG